MKTTAGPSAPDQLDIQTILVATDFSDSANRACDFAAALARQFGASLHLVHVLGVTGPAPAGAAGAAAVPLPTTPEVAPVFDEQRQAMQINLDSLIQRCQQLGLAVGGELLSYAGNPQHAIIETATRTRAGLIVMGTHGRSGLKRLVAGSVTEAVLRHCPIPIVAVPPPDRGETGVSA